MQSLLRRALSAATVIGLSAIVAPAIAGASGFHHGDHGGGARHAVFVQTDNLSGNQIVAYDRAGNGTLAQSAVYNTGGLGGALNGAAVDVLASQGSLTYDSNSGLLFAVNAGSNSVSVFAVDGSHLSLRQVVSSEGTFPVSVAVHGDYVYVLNAFNGGTLAGFWIGGDHLHFIHNSVRSLGLTIPTDTSQFTHTPGQVAFSPDGSQLLVTTKATTSAVDVFRVRWDGRLSTSPTVNVEPNAVPFAVTFDGRGRLIVAEAGTNAVGSFTLNHDGTITSVSTVATGQKATCWIAQAQGYLYASNAGSPSESTINDAHGTLTQLGVTATDPGAVDAAASNNGAFLYVQTGKFGIVDEFSVAASGSLTAIGAVTAPGAAGGEGIVAF